MTNTKQKAHCLLPIPTQPDVILHYLPISISGANSPSAFLSVSELVFWPAVPNIDRYHINPVPRAESAPTIKVRSIAE